MVSLYEKEILCPWIHNSILEEECQCSGSVASVLSCSDKLLFHIRFLIAHADQK